jgi:DNA-binding transcriptional LysR family regulator
MDRFTGMRTFVAVARSSSFTAAAAELAISPSLVSRHVAAVEADVGVQLVHRTPRAVRLTEAGVDYATFADRILGEIEAEHDRLVVDKDADEGKISIISPKWFGLLDLGDAIGDYLEAHPRAQVNFQLGGISDRVYDFIDRGFDIAFHARELRDSRVKVRRIAVLDFVLVSSRDYLAEHGAPTNVRELVEHDCLTHASDTTWKLVRDGRAPVLAKISRPRLTTNAYAVIKDSVRRGLGIGIVPRRLAEDELERGEFVEVLTEFEPEPRALYAVHGPGAQTPERVRQFLDFMVDWFQRHDDAAAERRRVSAA